MAKQEVFSTLSGQWIRRATDITDCLIGEGYNYLHYNVTSVKSPKDFPKTKIVLGLRVEVEEKDRATATKNILKAVSEKDVTGAAYLGKYTYVMNSDGTGPLKENRIDIPITVGKQTQKLFRIEVKPVKGGGSGGGSASTAINECMFAVYAALRFHVYQQDIDPEKGIDVAHLEQAYSHCKLDKPLKDLWADPVWHHSHSIGANILHKNLKGQFTNPEFWRGKGGDDKEIKKAYNRLNDSLKKSEGVQAFTSEDKWNPADIWIAEKGFNISALDDKNDAASINKFIADSYKLVGGKRKLVGVSLKKMGATANFKVVNDESPAQRKVNVESYKWVDKNARGGYDLIFENRGKEPIDAYLYFGPGEYDKFQLRNFGGKKASWQIELKGATAAHGRCGGGQVAQIVNTYAPGSFEWNNDQLYTHCAKHHGQKKKITKDIVDLLDEFDAKNIQKGIDIKRDKVQYTGIVARKEQEWRYSKLNGLRLLKALRDNPKKADQIVQSLYLFASSQLDFSSVFVKVY